MASDVKGKSAPAGLGWIGARLDRKMVICLLIFTLTGWLFSSFAFLSYLKDQTAQLYNTALEQSEYIATQAAVFLEGSDGDCGGLRNFLSTNDSYCTIKDESGEIIYNELLELADETGISATSTACAELSGGRRLWVTVRSPFFSRDALVDDLGTKASTGLLLFNFVMFTMLGLLFYFVFISPIINLRKMMKTYIENGTLPTSSTRQDEIGRLQNTFADLAGVLKAKEQSERRLIASISHDLKTPLTSILGYSQRLLGTELSPDKRERYTELIYEKGQAIHTIIDEFDEYLDAGLKDALPMELMTVQALCDTIKNEYCDELLDAGVKLDIDCQCPNARIICNTPHMKRYFGNLIGNSISHGHAKDLTLSLSCHRQEGEIIMEFADNGVGVPEGLLQSIFEPLYTSDKGRKVSGLGLSICRNIITAHGGRVTAENLHPGLLIKTVLPCAEM